VSLKNVGFWQRSIRKVVIVLAGTTVFQAAGCQISNGSEIFATWTALVLGNFVTTYVNGIFNVPSSASFI